MIEAAATIDTNLWSKITGRPIVGVESISRGRNGQVLKLLCRNRRALAAKQYYRHPDDHRDRLGTEVKALRLCREHNIVNVPEVVVIDHSRNLAVFTFIDGQRPEKNERNIENAASFLGKLYELSALIPPDIANDASEAFFSAALIIKNITERFNHLTAVENNSDCKEYLDTFLSASFKPAVRLAEDHCRALLEKAGIDFEQCLEHRKRLLSPSDIGFHNTLVTSDNQLFFLDFEYFGWDDPAKTVCDFVIHPHPCMNLNEKMMRVFVNKCIEFLPDKTWQLRAKAYYPLFRCKWSLILLNEFLPHVYERRSFAGAIPEDSSQILRAQLKKADICLSLIWSEYEKFCDSLA